MFERGMRVSIIGGPFAGHRGIVAQSPDANDPRFILVTVERTFGNEPVSKTDCTIRTPYTTYTEHWIARQHVDVI